MKSLVTAASGIVGADAAEHLAIVFDGVAALHATEDGVAAALGGDVQVGRALGQIADGVRAGRRSCPWDSS